MICTIYIRKQNQKFTGYQRDRKKIRQYYNTGKNLEVFRMALKRLNLSLQIGKYITHVSDYHTLCFVNKWINKSQVSPVDSSRVF
jgi:hypothetical protein